MKARGIPASALDIVSASLADSTYGQYDSCLRHWWQFCIEKHSDPFSADVPFILEFLACLVEKGASFNSTGCHRSAISLLLGPELAKDSRMIRFFRGLARIRPPAPRYDFTWDPNVLLQYFGALPPNSELPLSVLSKKSLALLALISAHRMQTFSLIHRQDIRQLTDRIEIRVPSRIKTSGPRRTQPLLVLPFYLSDVNICAASTLLHYLDRTKVLRQDISRCFISFKKPFLPVSSQSLSRWMKDIMEEAGIDTSIFRAHSSRHAATSKAHRSGIDVDLIRRTAGWSSGSSVFAHFYKLDVVPDRADFARALYDSVP